jgi:hypothetical protein
VNFSPNIVGSLLKVAFNKAAQITASNGTTTFHTIVVPRNADQMHVTLSWPVINA